MSVDLALDPITHKLLFPLRVIRGPAKIRQAVTIRLRTWVGEWFLDLDHGVPYLGGVLGRQRPEMVAQVLRRQILGVEGVKRIDSFTLDIDLAARAAVVRFTALVDGGEVDSVTTIPLRTVAGV